MLRPVAKGPRLLSVVSALGGTLLSACDDVVVPIEFDEPVNLVESWRAADPEAVGLEPGALDRARDELEAIPRALSLLVAKNGRLAYEAYFHGNRQDSLNDVRSVTKSVVSTLVGAALREGTLRSLDQTVGELLPPTAALVPADKEDITLRHLLTMSGGFEWTEVGAAGYNEWITSSDHLAYVLEQPLSDPPGSRFNYNSAAVHLLGVMLEGASGEELQTFADRVLFSPIGVSRSRWESVSNGFVNGGSGLDLRPRDLLRLGQLALQGGRSGTAMLVRDGWFEEAGMPQFGWRSQGEVLRSGSYGYLWWTESGRARDAFLAWGYGGQFVYVVPDADLVVVVTTDWRGVGEGVSELTRNVMRVIAERVVPAAR